MHACVRACLYVCLFCLTTLHNSHLNAFLLSIHSTTEITGYLSEFYYSHVYCHSFGVKVNIWLSRGIKATAKNGCKCERFDTVIFTTATANGYESANSIFGLCANVCTMHSEYIKWLLCTFYQNFQESFTIGKNRIN